MSAPIESGREVMAVASEQEQELPAKSSALGLTIRNAAQLPAEFWPDERISAIRAYVGKHAKTIGELAAFLATCQRYSLDPMVGQLFLIPSDSGPKVTTGRDTWLVLARREAGYAGCLFGTVHQDDEFGYERAEDGRIVVHHLVKGVQRGALIGAYCVVRDRLLGENIEQRELKDFNHLLSKNNWKNYKADMIQNRCIASVLRKQYGFPGLLIVGEEDEVTSGPKSGASPTVEVPRGAGNRLAMLVRAAHEDWPPASIAEIERDEVAVHWQDEAERGDAGSVDAPATERKEAPLSEKGPAPPDEYDRWKRLKLKGKKRTELDDVAMADLTADYPQFEQRYLNELADQEKGVGQ